MRRGRELAAKPLGKAALPPDRHRALHLLVDHPGGVSRCCSPSTTAAPGRHGRASRPAGSPGTPAASGRTPRSSRRSSTPSSWPCSASPSPCPLGVALALGLQRWRGYGSGPVNTLMLLPLVTPELVMGVALLLLFLQIFNGWGLGTTAQAIGQVTFAVSYVVVIVRGRLVSIGPRARGSRRRPRRAAGLAADARRPAAARAGDPRERGRRLRALHRRLRRHAVPLGRRGHEHRVDAALLDRARRADAGPERARHDHARDHAGDGRAGVPCLQTLRGASDASEAATLGEVAIER